MTLHLPTLFASWVFSSQGIVLLESRPFCCCSFSVRRTKFEKIGDDTKVALFRIQWQNRSSHQRQPSTWSSSSFSFSRRRTKKNQRHSLPDLFDEILILLWLSSWSSSLLRIYRRRKGIQERHKANLWGIPIFICNSILLTTSSSIIFLFVHFCPSIQKLRNRKTRRKWARGSSSLERRVVSKWRKEWTEK